MNLELLKKQVLQTICQYIDAKEPLNLNIEYCNNNNIQAGLCAYSHANHLHYLNTFIFKYSNKRGYYMYPAPYQLQYHKIYSVIEKKDLTFIDCHNARLKYLIQILDEIIFVESEKQKGNIYTYYKLIELFKF
jgi:hypothetical protein